MIAKAMRRVLDLAENIPGAETFQPGEGMHGLLEQNRAWILDKLSCGYTIVDLGLDPRRTERSPFHQMELEEIRNFWGLHG